MKRFDRGAFVVLSLLTLCSTALGLYCLATGQALAAKWLAAGGLLATAAGVVQLEVSGLFERIIEHYGNEEKYPYGPPSYITREIIDNPDRPFATWVRNICFFNVRTGFWLIVVGTLVQVVAVWL
jgi:hypothetical protein